MADAGDHGDGAGGDGAGDGLVVETHEVLEGTAAAHEEDRVRPIGGRHAERPHDRGRGVRSLDAAAHGVDEHERVSARERPLDVLDDGAGQRRDDADPRAEGGDAPLAHGVHEPLALELARELGHLLPEHALARDRDPARHEGHLAGALVDIELARELDLKPVLELEPGMGVGAAPDDDAHRGAVVLDLEIAVPASRVGAAEAGDLAHDRERRPCRDVRLRKPDGLGNAQRLVF